MFIFGIAIVFGVWMTRKVSNFHFGVKGQIYSKSVIRLYFYFLIEGVHIWHTDSLLCVDYNVGF